MSPSLLDHYRSLISNTEYSAIFIESITYGTNCVDQGTVELFIQDENMLKAIYYMPNGDIIAYADFVCDTCQLTNLNGFVDVLDGVWTGDGVQIGNFGWSIKFSVTGTFPLITIDKLEGETCNCLAKARREKLGLLFVR